MYIYIFITSSILNFLQSKRMPQNNKINVKSARIAFGIGGIAIAFFVIPYIFVIWKNDKNKKYGKSFVRTGLAKPQSLEESNVCDLAKK